MHVKKRISSRLSLVFTLSKRKKNGKCFEKKKELLLFSFWEIGHVHLACDLLVVAIGQLNLQPSWLE